MSFRILVDATAVPANRGGVGRYVDALLPELSGDIVIACQSRDAEYYSELAPHATVLPQPEGLASVKLRMLWEQFCLPTIARRVGATVIHSPHYTVPVFSRLAKVVTFHDATFFSHPKLHTPIKRWFFRSWIRLSLRRAAAVIVPSQATASELSRYAGVPIDRFDVAHHGVDSTIFHRPTEAELSATVNSLGLADAPWIAFLGTIEPRKNVPALVRAYREIAVKRADQGAVVPTLAIAGGRGWEEGLDVELALVQAPADVRMLGFIDVHLLSGFLGGATVVAYPSSGEGFGLPVLEAMASGAAVLTTRELALPEVGGDAVAYCDASDTSIEDGLEQLLSDVRLRAALASAGIDRARSFTWSASARIHVGVYERATGRKG